MTAADVVARSGAQSRDQGQGLTGGVDAAGVVVRPGLSRPEPGPSGAWSGDGAAPGPFPTGLVEPAGNGDLARIMDLEQSGFTAQRWSATSWAGEIGRPGHLVLVGRQATGLVAAAAWSVLAGAAELLRLVVDPAQRRLGWGRRLVEAGLDWAALNRAEAAFLEVSEDNQAAVDLYAAEGFVALDRRRDYYAPGRHAVVMRRPLAGPSQGGSGV